MISMSKIHVLFKKEEIDRNKIQNCVAVIIDVLLATTTIAAVLHAGVKRVLPVLDKNEAFEVSQSLEEGTFILAGELGGYVLPGFENPDPEKLINSGLSGKELILSTTNGTVAVKKSVGAVAIYTSSLLNGATVAEKITKDYNNQSVIIVCSGSAGRVSVEDLIGAGHLINELQKHKTWVLSDAAKIALNLFKSMKNNLVDPLQNSETGKLLSSLGSERTSKFASNLNSLNVVPTVKLYSNGIVALEDELRKMVTWGNCNGRYRN